MNNKEKLLKIAASMGLISSIVDEALNPEKQDRSNLKVVGTAGPGTAVQFSSNPINPDGTVDIIINFRGLNPVSTKSLGVKKGVLITANAVPRSEEDKKKNLGSRLLQEQYHIGRVNQMIQDTISKIQKQYPDKKITSQRIHVVGFSGGCAPASNLVRNQNSLNGKLVSVSLNDGLHTDPKFLNPIVDFAKKAKENPNEFKFQLLHTAIPTTSYASTTTTANYILDKLNIKKQEYMGDPKYGLKPTRVAKDGGVYIIEAFDKPTRYDIKNTPGSLGDQHIKAAKAFKWLYDPINEFIDKLEGLG